MRSEGQIAISQMVQQQENFLTFFGGGLGKNNSQIKVMYRQQLLQLSNFSMEVLEVRDHHFQYKF